MRREIISEDKDKRTLSGLMYIVMVTAAQSSVKRLDVLHAYHLASKSSSYLPGYREQSLRRTFKGFV